MWAEPFRRLALLGAVLAATVIVLGAWVRLTDAGRAVIRRLNAARLSGLEQFAQNLTDTERRALAGALSTLLGREDVAACRPEKRIG